MDDIETPADDAVTAILDGIPGAYERTMKGRAEAERGEVIPIEELDSCLDSARSEKRP